jgi:predicted TIM-barrel fold metal-dependent hydrolase
MPKAPYFSKRLSKQSPSAKLRAQLSHPVIDTDLHTVEFTPIFEDYIAKFGSAKIVDEYRAAIGRGFGYLGNVWYELTDAERQERQAPRPPWWGRASENTLDLATVSLPRLLHERLGDQGTDFAILYPNITTFAVNIGKEDLRRVVVRAVNAYNADIFRPYRDRLTPVAAIPLHTPQEGVEELEYAVNELGYKVALIPGSLRRPIAALAKQYPAKDHPEIGRHLTWLDTFGLDSLHNYDPFWAKAVELKVPLTTHTAGMGWTSRASWSNYMYNHIGHFASASEAFAKSLFLGGVTYRFPKLRVGLLEGGAAYGATLFADLVGHWEKRNGEAVRKYDPARLDVEFLHRIYRDFADEATLARLGSLDDLAKVAFGVDSDRNTRQQPDRLDDFAAAHVSSIEEIRDRYVPNFYFGAEADDPTVAYAFNTKVNPLGVELKAFWASDSGHWDVPDLTQVLSDTWKLVEGGALTEANFRDLVFGNPYEFYAGTNPNFFAGTAVEQALGAPRVAAE